MRQRRNKSATRATLAREVQPRTRAPSLPDARTWHKLTRAWWRDLWHSPMADEYLRADEHALFRLAVLIDMFWTDPTKEVAAEIRLQQQAFGLTPLDRRRLEWSIEQVEAAQGKRSQRKMQERIEEMQERADPRDVLKAPARIDLDQGEIPVMD